jgi:hypothetical protein
VEMLHRKPKRYRVTRRDDGYEVQDTDAAGAQVHFSDSRKSARKVSRQLNNTQRTQEREKNTWGGGGSAGGG